VEGGFEDFWVDALVVDGRSEAMMANWLLMMLDRKNNKHTEERDGHWRKAKHPIFRSSVCSDSFHAFREINGAVIKWRES